MTLPGTQDDALHPELQRDPEHLRLQNELEAVLALKARCYNYARAAYLSHAQLCRTCEVKSEDFSTGDHCDLGDTLIEAIIGILYRHWV